MRPELGAAALLTVLLTTGLHASAPPPTGIAVAPAIAAPVDEAAIQQTVAGAYALAQAKDCRGALAKLDPLALKLPPGKPRQSVQLVRMTCLAQVGRGGDLIAVQRELEAALPDQPIVRGYGITLALDRHDGADAADRLTRLATDDPADATVVTALGVRETLRLLGVAKDDARRDKLLIALARAQWTAADEPDLPQTIAVGAIHAMLADKAVDDAREVLPRVVAPELLAEMAMERLYAPLWPDIEARLGPASGAAVDAYARDQLDVFAQTPDDVAARRGAVRAFLLLRRLPEAVDTAAPVKIVDGMGDQEVDTIRYAAEALATEGQRAAAADRLRPFTGLDPKKSPEALTALISLAELLDEGGREEDALTVARTTMSKGATSLSPYGLSWLRRTEVCALAALGRGAEAKVAGDLLKSQAADNHAATIEGLLCAARRDEAAKLAIATLATPDGAEDLADQFQPADALWAPEKSRLRDLWTGMLASRADVRSAFERHARILPRALWPGLAPRPIPTGPAPAPDQTTT